MTVLPFLSAVSLLITTSYAACPFAALAKADPSLKNPHKLNNLFSKDEKVIEGGARRLAAPLTNLMICTKPSPVTTTPFLNSTQYDSITTAVSTLYDGITATCTTNNCPQADFAGCTLRLAGHDLMDYSASASSSEKGGADGCIDFDDADNSGLEDCTTAGNANSLNPVYEEYCDIVSLADFIVLAAEAVMTKTLNSANLVSSFKSNFKYGRTTSAMCAWNIGRLPNPERGCTDPDSSITTDLESVFIDNVFASAATTAEKWKLTAAISGAHTLGKGEISNSGYNGFWVDANNSRKFNNEYYRAVIFEGWSPEKGVNGNALKNQWKRTDVGVSTHKEFMLDSDMCLAYDQANAADQVVDGNGRGCCAWIDQNLARTAAGFSATETYSMTFCGVTMTNNNDNNNQEPWRENCCGGNTVTTNADCQVEGGGGPPSVNGVASEAMQLFSRDEREWLTSFQAAWEIGTTNGYDDGVLKSLDGFVEETTPAVDPPADNDALTLDGSAKTVKCSGAFVTTRAVVLVSFLAVLM